jgi:hypothetical protein
MNFSQNAKFALVIAEEPPLSPDPSERNWGNFMDNVPNKGPLSQGNELIHNNVWLIPLSTGLPFLGKLTGLATVWKIPLRVLFLEEKPDWILYPPDSAKKV